jgi:shikimate kinase
MSDVPDGSAQSADRPEQSQPALPDPSPEAPRNIVLTGFMGTGKSTVGRMLAQRLAMEYVDTDHMIERRHGPIPRIFEELGETGFREIERAIAKELSTDTGYVISTGGRFMLDPENVALLREGNRIFCLVAELEVIMERVMRRRSSRPMLAGDDPRCRVEELMRERAEGYALFEAVPTDERPPSRVVDDIISRL